MQDRLMEKIEAILFAAGDTVRIDRISLILGVAPEEIQEAADKLAEEYESHDRGIRVLKLGNKLQMASNPDFAQDIIKVLEHRKPPRLSVPALETLSIVAYFQPVTRAYIDQIRGVDSSYTVSVLVDKGLIEKKGSLNVPGRPALYVTTDVFLRTMNISDLKELPALPDVSTSEGVLKLQEQIQKMEQEEQEKEASESQMTVEDLDDLTEPEESEREAADGVSESSKEAPETTEELKE